MEISGSDPEEGINSFNYLIVASKAADLLIRLKHSILLKGKRLEQL